MNRILIIDDDMDMCALLSRFLQRKGFETDVGKIIWDLIASCVHVTLGFFSQSVEINPRKDQF